ncbi:MAG: DUF4350 domain-containing protein, partial [Armatimonadota bacterium]|nr:DUF4350 domain-containing protein [Armatimonadota bacterium]
MQWLRERLGMIVPAGLVAALLLYSLQLAQRARDPRFAELPLSYSQHRHGMKGFARLLERNGYTVRSFKRTFQYLPKDADMLVIFPPVAGIGSFSLVGETEDAQALERWLKQGGRLLLFSGDFRLPKVLWEDGINRLPPLLLSADKFFDAQPALAAPWLRGVRTVRMGDQRVNLSPRPKRWVPLLRTGGTIEAALWYYGDGVVFESTD